jgi:hypothetical protein
MTRLNANNRRRQRICPRKTRTTRNAGREICTVAKRKALVFRGVHETGHKNPRGRITLLGKNV